MGKWDRLAAKDTIDQTIKALQANGINAEFVSTGKEAVQRVFSLIPQGSEVMTMASVTIDDLGISKEIQESGKYNSVKNKLNFMSRETQGPEMQKLGAAPQYALGSVHAVSQDGHLLIASNTGSQLPAYAYGATQVIWVAGAQKIVKNTEEGMKRIYEYVLKLESARVKKAYGMERSNVSKLLIINKEVKEGRLRLIFVNEVLGF